MRGEVVINKNKYTFKRKVYHGNLDINNIDDTDYRGDYYYIAKILGLNYKINDGYVVGVDDKVIFMEYVNDARFIYHTKLFESH